ADPGFVKGAMIVAPRLSLYFGKRLGLQGKRSLVFDRQWLTRDGLAASRGQFCDYWEPRGWSVFLALKLKEFAKTSEPTSASDRPLAMGVGMREQNALLEELGADWDSYQRGGMQGPVLSAYPLLSRLGDITEDTFYEPDEVDALLAEYL